MLAKKYRFHRQNDVRRVYRDGNSARSNQLSLKYLKQKEPGEGRVAVVASKKVDKRAYVRNRIRRRVYEIIRRDWEEIEKGHDMVFMVYDKSLASMKHQELEELIKSLLKKANLLN